MRIANLDLIAATAQDMSSSFNLNGVWLGHICNFSIQLVFTGTPNGTFKLQGSNDAGSPDGGSQPFLYSGVTNWTDITGSSQAITTAGDLMYQFENAGFNFVRVVWTRSSSTGSLTSARMQLKGV